MKEILSSIFFLAAAASLLWGFDRWQKGAKDARSDRPSIGALATEKIVPSADPAEIATTPTTTPADTKPASSVTAAETLDVKVLNGGAAKGSAVKVQDLLKKGGYVKTQATSATGDYTGTTVYYLGSNEANATAVQKLLLKDYPKAEVKIATSSSAENGSAPVVVILGK